MRETLTLLAILLILVLAAALAGPHFVDWTAQRPLIEARLASVLGRPVRTSGAIDVQFLPSPILSLENAEMADGPGQPAFTAKSLRLELSPMPLLRGDLHFVDADIDQPALNIVIGRDGRIGLPFASDALGGNTQFERIRLHRARLTVDDMVSGRSFTVPAFDFDGEAVSLTGSFKGSGQILETAGPAGFRISTGVAEGGKYRLRAALDASAGHPQIEADGLLSYSSDSDGAVQPAFSGIGSMSGHLPGQANGAGTPWRISGSFQADRSKAESAALEFRLGPEDGGITASGTGNAKFGPAPGASLAMVARQVDLDHLGEGASLLANLRQMLGDSSFASVVPFGLSLDASTPLINLGGQILPDASLRIELGPGKPVGLKLGLNAPGRSSLTINGIVEPGPEAGFKGEISARTDQARRLADWLAPFSQGASNGLRALPFRRMDMSGHAEISSVHFAGRDLSIQLDRSNLQGALAYTRPIGDEPGRLFANLTSPALDLDEAPELAPALSNSAGLNLALELDARAVKLARFGEGMIDAGRIRFKLQRAGQMLTLDNFSIENLGGANLAAKGGWDGKKGQITGKIDAQRLADLTDLLRRTLPGELAEALAFRSAALSPANVEVAAEALAGAGGEPLPGSMTIKGTLGSTRLTASLRKDAADPGAKIADLRLDAADSAALLRQFGLEPSAAPAPGPASVTASLMQRAGGPATATVDAVFAGAHISGDGQVLTDAGSANGRWKVQSANAGAFLRLMGIALPDVGGGFPLAAGGDFDATLRGVKLSRLTGVAAGTTLAGSLLLEKVAAAPPAQGARFKLGGALQLDKLAFANLAALALGAAPPGTGAAFWTDARFGPGPGGHASHEPGAERRNARSGKRPCGWRRKISTGAGA